MDHVRLGRTGLQVSRLCLGTMTFGFQCDEVTSLAILDKAADAGITFFDTADAYPLGGGLDTVGRTEEIIGGWMKGRRHEFVVATKCFAPMSRRRWDRGNSRKHILDAVEGSLRRLGTDYIDLYQLHGPDPETPIDETLSALDDVVRSGKVRYVGCSNFLAYQLARAIGRSEAQGLVRLDSAQPRYNLLFRQIERELLPLCAEDGVGVIPYNPIAGGMLSGKHRGGEPPAGTASPSGRAAGIYQDRYWHEHVVRQRPPPGAPGRRGRHVDGGHGRGLGARPPGRHLADHRGQPARAARRQPGRPRAPARPGPEGPARRAHPPLPDGGRGPLSDATGPRCTSCASRTHDLVAEVAGGGRRRLRRSEIVAGARAFEDRRRLLDGPAGPGDAPFDDGRRGVRGVEVGRRPELVQGDVGQALGQGVQLGGEVGQLLGDGHRAQVGGSGRLITSSWPSAWRARSTFLSNLPTEVLGISSTNAHRSGSHHRATRPWRKSSSSSAVGLAPAAGTTQTSGPLLPAVVGHADHRRLEHVGVGHDLALELDRGDPLAAGLDDVLGAVGDLHEAAARRCSRRRPSAATRRGTWPGPRPCSTRR